MSHFQELDALIAEQSPEPRRRYGRRPDALKTGPRGPQPPGNRALRLESAAAAMREEWGRYKKQRHRMAALIRWGKWPVTSERAK